MAFLICQTEDPSKDILSEGHIEDIWSKISDNLHSLFFLEVLSIFLTLLHIHNSVTLLINLELEKKTIQESFSQLQITYLFIYYYFLLTLRQTFAGLPSTSDQPTQSSSFDFIPSIAPSSQHILLKVGTHYMSTTLIFFFCSPKRKKFLLT